MLKRLPGNFVPAPKMHRLQREASASTFSGGVVFACGVVKNVALRLPDTIEATISCARQVADATEKQIVKVVAAGESGNRIRRVKPGHVVHCAGRLTLRPKFNDIGLFYEYSHEMVITNQFGFANVIAAGQSGST